MILLHNAKMKRDDSVMLSKEKTKFTVAEVAKIIKKKPVTVYRDINKGRISTELDESNSKIIDASEIYRVYNINPCDENIMNQLLEDKKKTQDNDDIFSEKDNIIALLKEQLKEKDENLDKAQKQLERSQKIEDELRQDLRKQIEVNQAMLEAPSKTKHKESQGFFNKLFGG
jgi:ribonuclease D